MNTMNKNFFTNQDVSLEKLENICKQNLKAEQLFFTKRIEKNIPIYQGERLLTAFLSEERIKALDELHFVFKDGPGVLVIKNFFSEEKIIDQSNEIYIKIIEREKKLTRGDHFGNAKTNERVWNSFEKTCYENPQVFFDYYKNPLFNLVNEAWLGPFSSITAQVNVVKPGGKPQVAHRDYHLGFQSDEIISQFPLSLQKASQFLTLQGAIAHCDIPLEAGSTFLLPFSQQYDLGYLALRNKDFINFFEAHYVQLPLGKGDAVFFNPAILHAAGENTTTEIFRIVNLIQTSSAFGKPMEYINDYQLLQKLYPYLIENKNDPYTHYLIKNTAPGYAFPTNLDTNQPVAGNMPLSIYDIVLEQVKQKSDWATFTKALSTYYKNQGKKT